MLKMDKVDILRDIAYGLRNVHNKGLTHQDFHSGNILSLNYNCSIADLGLCKPANEKNNKTIAAPEVLRGKKYIQESDIYSFRIIIFEVCNGLLPYYDMAHEEILAIKICQGLRPRFNIKVPQVIDDIAKQCMDADPSKRPTAEYLFEILMNGGNIVIDGV
ncbi:kinase-like domain-containing protein, partial [Glomus cerebriforme]